MHSIEIDNKREFNSTGEKITITTEIQLKYQDLQITELPKACYACPVGYMDHDCGRRIPLDKDGRSPKCKLNLVSPEELISKDGKILDNMSNLEQNISNNYDIQRSYCIDHDFFKIGSAYRLRLSKYTYRNAILIQRGTEIIQFGIFTHPAVTANNAIETLVILMKRDSNTEKIHCIDITDNIHIVLDYFEVTLLEPDNLQMRSFNINNEKE